MSPPSRSDEYCPACGVDGHLGSAQRRKAHRAYRDGQRFGSSIMSPLFRAISRDSMAYERGAVRGRDWE
jgi:hypothetical protein